MMQRRRLTNPITHLNGWSYRGFTTLPKVKESLRCKLKKPGDAITEHQPDRLVRWVYSKYVTASSKVPIIDFYERRVRNKQREKK